MVVIYLNFITVHPFLVLVFQFHVVELGPHQTGNAALLSARGTLPFKGASVGDFPSAVQVSFLAVLEKLFVVTELEM